MNIYYHGTTRKRWRRIKTEGIRIRRKLRNHGDQFYEDDRDHAIWFTRDFDTAHTFAPGEHRDKIVIAFTLPSSADINHDDCIWDGCYYTHVEIPARYIIAGYYDIFGNGHQRMEIK
jgi:hypothetical protein